MTTSSGTKENVTTTEGFGTKAIQKTTEGHISAQEAAATATVQARFVLALQRPRSWDNVRVKLLKECSRPGFAQVARYRKPIGKGVEGPSIRFAEACLRYAGNVDASTSTVQEDAYKRVIHVSVTDYETNASYGADITIDKTVERHDPRDRVVLGERTNTTGRRVFIVMATEDDLLNKTNAQVSKAIRTLALRIIPGDIIEEGQQRCMKTLLDAAAKDPEGEKKAILDAFASVGVMPGDIVSYLGHPLDSFQPAELVDLRKLYASLRDGETSWAEIVQRSEKAEDESKSSAATSQAQRIQENIKAKSASQEGVAQATQPKRGA